MGLSIILIFFLLFFLIKFPFFKFCVDRNFHIFNCTIMTEKLIEKFNFLAYPGYAIFTTLIPGLIGAYCLYFDIIIANAHYYYYWAFMGSYGFAVILGFLVVIITSAGQPMLVFIVPCTCGTLALLAYARNQFRPFWTGSVDTENVQIENQTCVIKTEVSDSGQGSDQDHEFRQDKFSGPDQV